MKRTMTLMLSGCLMVGLGCEAAKSSTAGANDTIVADTTNSSDAIGASDTSKPEPDATLPGEDTGQKDVAPGEDTGQKDVAPGEDTFTGDIPWIADTSDQDTNAGKLCGPIPDGACPTGQICAIESCGVGATGHCKNGPTPCAAGGPEVCGCDGKTYQNDCIRSNSGVGKAHDGVCETIPKSCGGLTPFPNDCGADEYCAYDLGAMCGAADASGTCTKIPSACDAILDPVCGCDGKDYSNTCAAAMAKTGVSKKGTCKAKVCGPILNGLCADGEACDISGCGIGALGTCYTKFDACPMEIMGAPVCGCDGKTYSDDCFRKLAGVAKNHDGACP